MPLVARAACVRIHVSALFFAALASAVSYAQVSWTGAATPDPNWQTAHNWLNDTPPADGNQIFFEFNATQNLATINDFANLNVGGIQILDPAGPVSIGGNGFTLSGNIDSAVATQPLTIALNAGQAITIPNGAIQTWSVKAPTATVTTTLTISSPIVGDATTNIKFATPGGTAALRGTVQLLAASPNFAGVFEIGGPFMLVVVGDDDSFGTNKLFVNSFNTAPQLQAVGGTRTIDNDMDWHSGFGVAGTNDFIFNGDVKFTNATGGANRSLTTATAVDITMNGTITMGDPDVTPDNNRSLTITPVADSTITLNGLMQDPTSATNTEEGFFVKNGAGLGVITHTANTYSGSNQVGNGILEIHSLGPKGTPSSLGTGNTNPEIALGGAANTGTLRYLGSANVTTDRPLRLQGTSGGGALENNGTGTLNFTSPTFGTPGNGAKTLTLAGTNSGANTIAGVIANASATNTTKVAKTGSGTWVLTGANTYSGGTQVDGGVLRINNTSGSGTGSGAITVNNGGTVGGTGTLTGAMTVNNFGAISPGTPETAGGIGTLALGNTLTFSGGAILNADFGSAGAHDLVNVTGGVNLPASGTVTVNIANLGGMAAGTYPLVDYTGALTGAFSTLTLGTQPAGFTYSFVNNAGNTSIDLQISGGASLNGDFNNDGEVDAADYVTWRENNGTNNALPNDNGLGTPIGPDHYTLWRASFGNPPGSGAGLGGQSVPEPSAILVALTIIVGSLPRRAGR
jgi:autotransporter-associated beta strand protein